MFSLLFTGDERGTLVTEEGSTGDARGGSGLATEREITGDVLGEMLGCSDLLRS